MPYIKGQRRRSEIAFGDSPAKNAGELNYLITLLLLDYLKEKELSYQTLNDIVGALEGAKLEFVRRVVNPYEDQKIKENGDVYEHA
jgi:hypothetical protein